MTKKLIRNAAQWLIPPLRYCRHRIAPRRSYAADREDVAIELLLGAVRRFIDVGANDGFTCSNCFRFALCGAMGLSFEPDPANFVRLKRLMHWNGQVRCIPEGLSDTGRTLQLRSDGLLSVLVATDDPGLANLLDVHRIKNAPEVTVRVSRLSEWLEQWPAFASSDVLSVDVEGHELCVLQGIDWARTPKPARCVVVETHAAGVEKSWKHRDFDRIDALLATHGYERVCASANNTFWIHHGDCDPARIARARSALPGYRWETAWA